MNVVYTPKPFRYLVQQRSGSMWTVTCGAHDLDEAIAEANSWHSMAPEVAVRVIEIDE